MDIAYLLWLQGIRESLPGFVEQFFVLISDIANSAALIAIPCILYWCLDKRGGQYLMFTFSLGSFVNQLVKNTVCCYRPWIRCADIHPAEAALPGTTGYSFPSGHTQTATSVIGALGWRYRARWPRLNVACWVFVVLVAFSRNFLGVHTSQDVIVAMLEGICFIVAVPKLLDWVDEQEGHDRTMLVICLVAVVAYVAYIVLKPYPTDYDASHTLIVDPVQMQVDCFKSAGALLGAVVGWYLERRFLDFEADPRMGAKRIALRIAVGAIVVLALHLAPRTLLLVKPDERVYEFVKYLFTIFAATFVAPAAFCAVERRLG